MTVGVTEHASGVMLAAVLAALPSGYVDVFSNARPATPGAAAGASPMASYLLNNPTGVVAAGELTLSSPTQATIATSSTVPTWARLRDSSGNVFFDFDARLSTAADNGEQLVIVAESVTAGDLLRILTGVIRF